MARLRERSVFANHGLSVIAVESLELRTGRTNRGRFIIGGLKPIAVIVKEADRTREFDIDSSMPDST